MQKKNPENTQFLSVTYTKLQVQGNKVTISDFPNFDRCWVFATMYCCRRKWQPIEWTNQSNCWHHERTLHECWIPMRHDCSILKTFNDSYCVLYIYISVKQQQEKYNDSTCVWCVAVEFNALTTQCMSSWIRCWQLSFESWMILRKIKITEKKHTEYNQYI